VAVPRPVPQPLRRPPAIIIADSDDNDDEELQDNEVIDQEANPSNENNGNHALLERGSAPPEVCQSLFLIKYRF
jgi:hypothetical protein